MLKKFRYLPVVAVVAGLVYLWTHESGGGALRPPAERKPVDMSFPLLDGGVWSLAGERGRVVVVNFWATWCPPCRAETPALMSLANDYRARGVTVVGASLDEGGARPVREFVRNYGVNYLIGMPPPDSAVASAISSLPTTLLVDRQGRVAKTYLGAVSGSALRRDVDALLAEQP